MADTGKLTLYDLTEEIREFEQALIESGGVITDEMEEQFDDLLDAEKEKTESYVGLIREFEETAEAVKREEKRLRKRRKSFENSVESLMERLLWAMKMRGETVRETDIGKVRVQKASRRGTTVKVEAEKLPERFQKWSVRADTKAIREALEQGDEVAAEIAEIDEPTEYIRIY